MSLRPGTVPFTSIKEVRKIFGIAYATAKEWLHVASIAGSCAVNGKGNDLDIIMVPFWNGPTDPYPTRLPLDSVEHMIDTLASRLEGKMPEYYVDSTNREINAQADFYSGVLYRTIWLPDNKVVDLKCYPADYVRVDIRKALDHSSVSRKKVHSQLFPFPMRVPTERMLERDRKAYKAVEELLATGKSPQ